MLIDVNECVLIVIDVQDEFLSKLDQERATDLVARISWLIDVAYRLEVPIVVTAEDSAVLGASTTPIARRLRAQTPQLDKQVFGLASDAAILKAVRATNRRTAVLVGLETDVCVAHSALGLLALGYRVAVVQDGVASPGAAHAYGLDRMRSAGVIPASAKGLYYEWLRTVPAAVAFRRRYAAELECPPNLTL